jgi:hypothetical protein
MSVRIFGVRLLEDLMGTYGTVYSLMMRCIGIQDKGLRSLLFLLLVIALSGCALFGGGDGEAGEGGAAATVFGEQQPLVGEAFLVCTQECSDRGFCGTRDTGERVVLLNSPAASTQTYNLFVVENTPVNIIAVDPKGAFLTLTGAPLTINYYQVEIANIGQGWVAGWCVGQ